MPFFVVQSLLANNSNHLIEQIEECRYNSNDWPSIVFAVDHGYDNVVKFLIDFEEDLLATTPSTPTFYETDSGTHVYGMDEPGYNALEWAVKKQDAKMVEILLFYHPENRADPQFERVRYREGTLYEHWYAKDFVYKGKYFRKGKHYECQGYIETISVFTSALRKDNEKISCLLISAYQHPHKLFSEFEEIRAKGSVAIMQSWMERNYFLWREETKRATEEEAQRLIQNFFLEALQKEDMETILTYIDWAGGFLSKNLALRFHKIFSSTNY